MKYEGPVSPLGMMREFPMCKGCGFTIYEPMDGENSEFCEVCREDTALWMEEIIAFEERRSALAKRYEKS